MPDADGKLTMAEQRQGTADYFKTGEDYGEKLKKKFMSAVGMKDPYASEPSSQPSPRRSLADQMADSQKDY